MTDPATARPSFSVAGWMYTSTTETRSGWKAYDPLTMQDEQQLPLQEYEQTTMREKIVVVLRIADAPLEPVPPGRSGRRHIIQRVRLQLGSQDGSAWSSSFRMGADGHGIKKDGSQGADTEIQSYDFPQWLKDLLGIEYSSLTAISPVLEWANKEYPR